MLLAHPLVWIESIEYIAPRELNITYLELMGTQRARRLSRQVHDPGTLKKGFGYMWDGESAPLQMTPFLHLEENDQDELVYVVSSISRDPIYQARGSSTGRRPDQLMSQLEERVPFLLRTPASVTSARAPDAAKFYRHAVELALADGGVTPPEAERLEEIRRDLGIGEEESALIHCDAGWFEEKGSDHGIGDGWPEVGRLFALEARDATLKLLQPETPVVLLDPELDARKGRVWFQLDRARGVGLWYPSKVAREASVAVGFYSQRTEEDATYEKARDRLERDSALRAPQGWTNFSRDSDLDGVLALEIQRTLSLDVLKLPATVAEIAGTIALVHRRAASALAAEHEATQSPAPIPVVNAPVSAAVPDDFPLPALSGSPRLQGSVWLARILWALEHARRNEAEPRSAADIARILQQNGVNVPATNTARAFRTPQDDPRVTKLCDEPIAQRYVISGLGRRVLFEWLTATAQ